MINEIPNKGQPIDPGESKSTEKVQSKEVDLKGRNIQLSSSSSEEEVDNANNYNTSIVINYEHTFIDFQQIINNNLYDNNKIISKDIIEETKEEPQKENNIEKAIVILP